MDTQLDSLFQEWYQLGGAVLLARKRSSVGVRPPEEVIAESTAYCRESGRLTWVVLDWLIRHVEQIDEQKLLQESKQKGELSVLGVLSDAAYRRIPHSKLEYLISACAPHNRIEPFFHRVARSPLASRIAQENGLDLFRKWNYLCSELRYL